MSDLVFELIGWPSQMSISAHAEGHEMILWSSGSLLRLLEVGCRYTALGMSPTADEIHYCVFWRSRSTEQ